MTSLYALTALYRTRVLPLAYDHIIQFLVVCAACSSWTCRCPRWYARASLVSFLPRGHKFDKRDTTRHAHTGRAGSHARHFGVVRGGGGARPGHATALALVAAGHLGLPGLVPLA